MGTPATKAKMKYNRKTYSQVIVQLKKELVAEWSEYLAEDNIAKSEFVRNAITEYVERKRAEKNSSL